MFQSSATSTERKKRSLEDYTNMTIEEHIQALRDRDKQIEKLQKDCKRIRTTLSQTTVASPEQLEAQAAQLRQRMAQGIQNQMKWKPSCKRGTARFSYEGHCDEPTFRVLMKLTDKEKTKGKRMEASQFQDLVLEESLSANIRYGALYLCGNINVSYSPADNTIKVTGGYGM